MLAYVVSGSRMQLFTNNGIDWLGYYRSFKLGLCSNLGRVLVWPLCPSRALLSRQFLISWPIPLHAETPSQSDVSSRTTTHGITAAVGIGEDEQAHTHRASGPWTDAACIETHWAHAPSTLIPKERPDMSRQNSAQLTTSEYFRPLS